MRDRERKRGRGSEMREKRERERGEREREEGEERWEGELGHRFSCFAQKAFFLSYFEFFDIYQM